MKILLLGSHIPNIRYSILSQLPNDRYFPNQLCTVFLCRILFRINLIKINTFTTMMNRTYFNFFAFLFFGLLLTATACNSDDDTTISDDDDTNEYTIPTTYNFDNVSYSGQIARLAMLTEMKSYMATSRTSGTALDADRLKAMYANDSANAGWSQTYDESKQMKNKTLESERDDFEALMDELAQASTSTVAGSEGVSGVIESQDGSKRYLIGEDGLDHAQVIEKGLMGALLYYQALAVYFGDDRMNVDNETVEPGEGTAMEHHWDEAFGYLGAPIDFPTNTDGLAFWANYSNNYNDLTNTNKLIMDGMLKGRAAISNDDLSTRDEAIEEVRAAWELVAVGSTLHYLNVGINNFDDMSIRAHGLSEAIGFAYSLKFNPSKKLDNTKIDDLLTLIAGSADFAQMNLYQITVDDLQQAKDQLATDFELDSIKDDF